MAPSDNGEYGADYSRVLATNRQSPVAHGQSLVIHSLAYCPLPVTVSTIKGR